MLLRSPYVSLGLAVVFGLGAALFASRWLSGRMAAAEDGLGSTPVVVAAVEISFGARIRPEDLRAVAWPKDSVPEGAYRNADEVAGKYASAKLVPGEVVLRSRALSEVGGSALSGLIEPNKRAITVRVNDVIGVAGFLLPGNRVDVLATRVDDRRATTRTLLQNLKVLAVDQTQGAQADQDRPVVVRAVTLEMDPGEAEQLVAATEEGSVQLALRNPEDLTVARAPERIAAAAPKAAVVRAARAPARAQSTAGPARDAVTVIRQTQVARSPVDP
jgi:pilus assembly protein CpaB